MTSSDKGHDREPQRRVDPRRVFLLSGILAGVLAPLVAGSQPTRLPEWRPSAEEASRLRACLYVAHGEIDFATERMLGDYYEHHKPSYRVTDPHVLFSLYADVSYDLEGLLTAIDASDYSAAARYRYQLTHGSQTQLMCLFAPTIDGEKGTAIQNACTLADQTRSEDGLYTDQGAQAIYDAYTTNFPNHLATICADTLRGATTSTADQTE